MKKKLLVCGATGFIGRNMAEHFSKGDQYEVYGTYFKSKPYENSKIKFVHADLTNREQLDKVMAGMDVVVHAAAVTSGAKDIVSKPYIHVTDNAVMSSLIFRAAFEHKVSHFIFFSCSVMYQSRDWAQKETDFNAQDTMVPQYFGGGSTKVYLERMCDFFSRFGGTKFTAIRHSNIYGPHDKYDLDKSHVFGATMTKVLTATDKVTVWGDGTEGRDLVYVSDLVDFVQMALDKQNTKYELVNVGLGQAIPIGDLVKKIVSQSGKNIKIEYDTSKPQIKTTVCLDSTKAKELFGWTPKVSIDEGIQRTMTWYRDNIRL